MALTDKLTAIGDAIREKNGSTELLTLDEMPQAIADISSGGGGSGEDILDSIFDGTITEFYSLKDLTAYSSQNFGTLFNGCDKMVKWAMPNLTKELNYAFRYCPKLTYIDIGKPSSCAPATFYGKQLKGVSVVIRSEIPPTLSSVFNGTGFDSTTVFYVPKNSIEAYKTATNWSTYADYYKAIEDYPEITGGII